MIRLLIADDHEILREGLKYVVSHSRDISVVGEADTAESTLQLCRTTPADVLLLDVSMPGPGVLDTIRNVKGIRPGWRRLSRTARPPTATVSQGGLVSADSRVVLW
jgi:DNA-binding NarL/FixJ family response regulator